jgi:4-hydroxy-tetrahydrodipicolinate reductase
MTRLQIKEFSDQEISRIFVAVNLTSVIPGGVNGDIATCAITINTIHAVLAATPGLKIMLDLPVPSWFSKF